MENRIYCHEVTSERKRGRERSFSPSQSLNWRGDGFLLLSWGGCHSINICHLLFPPSSSSSTRTSTTPASLQTATPGDHQSLSEALPLHTPTADRGRFYYFLPPSFLRDDLLCSVTVRVCLLHYDLIIIIRNKKRQTYWTISLWVQMVTKRQHWKWN